MKNSKSIFKKIDKCSVVSFDIFDTLLKRNVSSPESIFKITEILACKRGDAGYKGFYSKRISAGKAAASKSINGEAELNDIYAQLVDYSEEQRSFLKSIELETELKYLQKNIDIAEIYSYCVNKKKKIIVTSDMYLPSDFLKSVLSKNGFECEKLYVSCELKENKSSGGIFKKIQADLSIKPSEIVHIGDNLKSDYLIPLKSGWNAVHIKNVSDNEKYDKIEDEVIASYIRNNNSDDYFFNAGFSLLGPLLLRFSFWLKEQTTVNKDDMLLFLSRDGQIMQKAYNALFENETDNKYIYVSRKALNTAMLWKHPEFSGLKNYITVTNSFTIASFLSRVGLEPESFEERLSDFGLKTLDEYYQDDFWDDQNVKRFYASIKDEVIKNSREQFAFLKKYVYQLDISGNIGIVDIGWRGSMQKRLNEFFADNKEFGAEDINGYYFGIETSDDNMHGFLFEGKKTRNKTVIDAGFGLFETFFLAHEGTTLSYRAKDNKIVPVIDEYEIHDEKIKEKLDRMHSGAISFIKGIKNLDITEVHEKGYVSKNYFDGFSDLIFKPDKRDIKCLSSIPFNDTVNSKIVVEKGFFYYLLHSRDFAKDYHAAAWKIGFLNKNCNSFIPWGSIYKKMKML